MQFENIRKRLEGTGIQIDISSEAVDWAADQGFDPHFGARPVKRVLQKYVLNELSKKILEGTVNKDSKILIDYFGEQLVFRNQ